MKIQNLTENSTIYTSNVYLITGTWNAISDVNTLIDVGRDPDVIDKINNASTGVGKQRVEQVILTHNHYDHASMLPQIKRIFKPVVRAFSRSLKGVDCFIKDGDILKLGDRSFEAIHSPGHSSDSICLYCEEEGVLFAGDTPVIIRSTNGFYEDAFVMVIEKLCHRDISSIYFGHGAPMLMKCNLQIQEGLKNIRKILDYRFL